MLNYLVGEDAVLSIDLIVDGEFTPADVNSATFTVRNNAGSIISSLQAVALNNDADATRLLITIPSTANTIANGLDAERRFVTVNYVSNSTPYRLQLAYRVIPFLVCSADAARVRSILGVSASELADSEIDIPSAYFELKNKLSPGVDLDDAYVTSPMIADAADAAVAITAAMQILPSLTLRVMQAKESDGSALRRFGTFNPFTLKAELSKQRAKLIDLITGVPEADLVRVVLTQDTDQFPGG